MTAWKVWYYQTPDGRNVVAEWLQELRDVKARARITIRLRRVIAGHLGDCKPLREGVWELRIDHGPGYRVYYARTGRSLILLLCGGDKRKQEADIDRAVSYWRDWQRRNPMSRRESHDEVMIKLLRQDPVFAAEYVRVALEEVDEKGGQVALLAALRDVARARGMAYVAKAVGVERESLYRTLSPRGNPRLTTLVALMKTLGLSLTVTPSRRKKAA
jgi:putative addiction module killer protein/probable addiction module antidote protein